MSVDDATAGMPAPEGGEQFRERIPGARLAHSSSTSVAHATHDARTPVVLAARAEQDAKFVRSDPAPASVAARTGDRSGDDFQR